ncbi:hypothetical protein MSTE_03534 [Mycobacteroides stephanolepidis]|uniref:Type VII secretion system protein EssD-like domain-containing protein n=1 Tax=[Mycobacterium] stephanolepidis TaxID=1520670 RepID=A0A1Z4F0X4_9MYCO|nr:DNA/RNA non-specific endonuclease [[Mycobacterium] stephanolepidis]BAX98834.1 hypothetical protein MSTE_03534 [[Mycobacterium] stephanolepidis]
MSLSLAEIKRAKVQTFRDVADALDGMAGANQDMKRGVERLPIMGDGWKGVSGDAAHQDIDTHGKYLDGHAQAQQGAARKIRAAADEFEGVQQLLKKIESDAANGKFSINYDTGEVTPPNGKYDKNELDYLTNTLRQIRAAGDAANTDLEAAVKAAQTLPDPSGLAGAALPVTPNSSTKPDGSFGALQNLATAKPDGRPAETQAAAAGADTQANYKEWYPKAPATGDKITIDPTKAGSFTGTVGALEKLPGTPKPPDGFGTGVARKFGDGVNSRVDGIVDEAKNLTGQGGPGAPGVAESWAKFVLGTADQMANPLGSLPGDVKDLVNDPAGFAGKKLFDVASVATTGPLGGEASAGMRGLLGDLTGAETRAIPHSIDTPHPAPVVEHTPAGLADHPAPSGGHSAGGDHMQTGPQAPELNHVSAESGGPGGWNQELNKPAPNTHYNVDDRFQYSTDDQRRVGHAEMTYDHGAETGDRNGHQQRIAGGPDRLPGDQGGHIFGTQFGGPGEAINITAMRDTLNQVGARDYYNLETQWRQLAEHGQVQVKVDISYPGDSLRPESYTVETYVDGKLNSTYHFDN